MAARAWSTGMKKRSMSEAKNDICSIIREAEKEEVLITRHGKPAAVVIGFRDEDDWFDYKIEHDERFLRKIAKAREEIRKGAYVTLDELPD
jgi:prevent-host-death family protein